MLQGFAHLRRQRRIRVRVRVENAHDALAVTDELAQPARIERRVVALFDMSLGEEMRQGLGALDVALGEAGAGAPQTLQVEPVEIAVRLLHELEELRGIAGGNQLARSADEA